MVGYSKLLINEQTRLLRELNELVQGTEQFRTAQTKNGLVRVATGDGMALVFRDNPESPVRCALQISRALRKQTPVPIRMGVHSGPVNEVRDVNNRRNVAGAGINIAQRVMDCGDAGHILLSKHVAEDLEHHARWRPFLHDLGQCEVKHGSRIALVNLYSSEAGNPQLPEKIRRLRKKRTANSVLLFSTTAALSLAIAGSSWFFSTYFSTPSAAIPKDTDPTTPPATTPMTAATSTRDIILANTSVASSIWQQPPQTSPTSRPRKLFAGTWRGTVHSVGPQSTWDTQLELNVDETETHLSNLTGGSVSRHGRTLTYKRSYKLGNRTSVRVHASLIVQEDDKTATYTTSQISVTGKSRSKTSGRGMLEKVE